MRFLALFIGLVLCRFAFAASTPPCDEAVLDQLPALQIEILKPLPAPTAGNSVVLGAGCVLDLTTPTDVPATVLFVQFLYNPDYYDQYSGVAFRADNSILGILWCNRFDASGRTFLLRDIQAIVGSTARITVNSDVCTSK